MGESIGMEDPDRDPALVVLRCEACGDTFPVERGKDDPACPSCGSEDVHDAGEPLL